MNQQGIYHEPKSKYAYAYDQTCLHIRMRSAKDDLKSVQVVAFDPYSYIQDDKGDWSFDNSKKFLKDMVKEQSDDLFDYWFCDISEVKTLRIRYGFILQEDQRTYYFGPNYFGALSDFKAFEDDGYQYFNFPYINHEDVFKGPTWAQDTIWYQIYPERFHHSEDGTKPDHMLEWNSQALVSNDMVFGGNLQGVVDQLDYLEDLGVTGIYFTPIFESPSTHKYDTSNYFKIDPVFGDDETLKTLVKSAHERNIKVMLDGVFNHCGYRHPFWQDVLKHGSKSRYYSCFYIDGHAVQLNDSSTMNTLATPKILKQANYRMFGTDPNMPKWNTSHPLVRKHLIDVGKYWIENFDIDGWRLDVSNEVSHDFWRAFRKEIKATKEEVYIIGENWDHSYPWLNGDQFDGVMNYELTHIILNFLGTHDIHQKYDAKKFVNMLGRYQANYPKNILPYMFNMMDSHDTPRVMTVCHQDIRKTRLVYLMQFLMPGAPSILYGSEIGLEGNFETARACMVFDEDTSSHELYQFLKALIALRKTNSVFKVIEINVEALNSHVIQVIKKYQNSKLIVIMNNSDTIYRYETEGELIEIKPFSFYMTINDKSLLSEFS